MVKSTFYNAGGGAGANYVKTSLSDSHFIIDKLPGGSVMTRTALVLQTYTRYSYSVGSNPTKTSIGASLKKRACHSLRNDVHTYTIHNTQYTIHNTQYTIHACTHIYTHTDTHT